MAVRRADEAGGWTRRQILAGATTAAAGWLAGGRIARADEAFALPDATRTALARSPLVYVSPLRSDGGESTCHGEVWYFVDQGSVVIFTATDRWKARAVRRGLDRARLWVGDFGPVGRARDRYRRAPTFVARATIEPDRAVFERLMERFATRYADEWGKWGPRFRKGWDDGSRVMIRYTPIGA
jgi:hypothetical protein